MRTFKKDDADSSKFWNIEVVGTDVILTFGKVGTTGQTRTNSFDSEEKAQKDADKRIREKLKKGYLETTPKPPASEAEAFEQALSEDPNDLAGRCAYADWLMEQGDSWGEFMQVQLALEDEKLDAKQRRKLHAREKELLANHERDWLGSLAEHLLDQNPNHYGHPGWELNEPSRLSVEYHWRRGFLAEMTPACLTVTFAQALADAPAARLLEKLHVQSTAAYLGMEDTTTPRRTPSPNQYPGADEWLEMLGAPLLKNLRFFQMGDIDGEPPEGGWCDNHTYSPGIERFIAEMDRIEELHLLCKEYDQATLFALPNLTNLRVLRMYALGEPHSYDGKRYEIELDVLAVNPALGKLTHLMVHPHFTHGESFLPLDCVVPVFQSAHLKSLEHLQLRCSSMGDEGAEEIVSSGILKRLKWLDLRHGCITDEGARIFADCADTKNLDCLDLSRNAVSASGLKMLREAGVNAVAKDPLTARELNDDAYLQEGDFE